jgi:citrate lyase beta subunit
VAGIESPLDAPEVEIRDTAVAYESAMTAKRFGFGGKLLIHPAQVAPVHQAFTPSSVEVDWATSIVGSSGGALQIDGKMVDKPLVERARRILEALEEMT